MKKVYEEEWYSNCCDAPPMYDVPYETFGLCMKCRDNSAFEIKVCNEIE